MKIKLNEKTYFETALKLALAKEDEEAILFFNKCGGYKSALNKFVLLMRRRDVLIATDLYYEMLVEYGEEYDVFADVRDLLGEVGKPLLMGIEKRSADRPRQSDKKRVSKKDLLRFYNEFDDERQDAEGEVFTQDDFVEFLQDEGKRFSTIHEVGGKEYLEALQYRFNKALVEFDREEAEKCVAEITERDSDDVDFLALKMYFLAYFDKPKQAEEIACRLAYEDVSPSVLSRCVDLIGKDNDALLTALERLRDVLDDLDEHQIVSAMRKAALVAKEPDLAADFADYLYDFYESFHFSTLRQCAVVFHNCGDEENAVEALKTLLLYMPNDAPTVALLNYVRSEKRKLNDALLFGDSFSVPRQVFARAVAKLANPSEDVDEIFLALEVVLSEARSSVLQDKKPLMTEEAVKALSRPEVLQSDQFVPFALRHLSVPCVVKDVKTLLLKELLSRNYSKKMVVNYSGTDTYELDPSILQTQSPDDAEMLAELACRVPMTAETAEQALRLGRKFDLEQAEAPSEQK